MGLTLVVHIEYEGPHVHKPARLMQPLPVGIGHHVAAETLRIVEHGRGRADYLERNAVRRLDRILGIRRARDTDRLAVVERKRRARLPLVGALSDEFGAEDRLLGLQHVV